MFNVQQDTRDVVHHSSDIPVSMKEVLGLQGVQSSHKMGDSLPWTPMNHRAKFDAASFTLGREICNRTKNQTHKQWRIYPHPAHGHVWMTNKWNHCLVRHEHVTARLTENHSRLHSRWNTIIISKAHFQHLHHTAPFIIIIIIILVRWLDSLVVRALDLRWSRATALSVG